MSGQRRLLSLRTPRAGTQAVALLLAGAMLAAVISARGAAGWRSSGPPASLDDVPGVVRRTLAQRYCARGEGTTGEVPQAVASHPGAVVTAETGAAVAAVRRALDEAPPAASSTGHGPVPLAGALHPLNLVRPARPELPGWRSRSFAMPEQVGFELEGTVTVDRVAFWHVPDFSEGTWARNVVLYLSVEAPDRGFYKIGGWQLAATTRPQVFALPFATAARYVRLCILAIHGDAGYVSLGGFALGVLTGTPADSLPPGPPA